MSKHSRISRWAAMFGPGAIVASLTIGSGELIFSSRGGAVFGYRLLGTFLLICLLKWALVLASARHIVLTGAHPFQRWMDCPGPRGWLPLVYGLLAIVCFPIWVGFHAGTVGTLLKHLLGTERALDGGSEYAWGLAVLGATMLLVWSGSYQRLERVQLVVVILMLVCVVATVVRIRPDVWELLREFWQVHRLEYPEWARRHAAFQDRPVWVELANYVGVIGGSGYDYLAYVSFLRDKEWGAAGGDVLNDTQLSIVAQDPEHPHRRWLVAPLVDASISFLIVFIFSGIFLTCGAEILRPRQVFPAGDKLLTLQAEFVDAGAAGIRPLYFAGALLAMLGTLYGTIEVAPTIAREMFLAFNGKTPDPQRLHRRVTTYVGLGGAVVLAISLAAYLKPGDNQPPQLDALLSPANLFTGVLACGVICWLSLWMEQRWLPRTLRMPLPLALLNAVGGTLFIALGIKAYWDKGGLLALGMLAGTVVIGITAARFVPRSRRNLAP